MQWSPVTENHVRDLHERAQKNTWQICCAASHGDLPTAEIGDGDHKRPKRHKKKAREQGRISPISLLSAAVGIK